jgi:alkylation response protein AidB-like acyl-CoA dehydrogenase
MQLAFSDRQSDIQRRARRFAEEHIQPLSREMDEQGRMPRELITAMGAAGLIGGGLPAEFGGEGWDSLALALCYEELGRVDSSVRGFLTVQTSLVSRCILEWGSAEQHVHQAWGQVNIPGAKAQVRVGRQEIAWHGQRLIGSVLWTHQGRPSPGDRIPTSAVASTCCRGMQIPPTT